MNDENQVLLIQEKHNFFEKVHKKWKFPGGLCDQFEDLSTSATREVLEETGVKSQFNSILGMRHQHYARLGGSKTKISDLYIACHLSPISNEIDINIDESEVKAAKWMDIEEFVEKRDETWPVNTEFATILLDGLKSNQMKQNKNRVICGLAHKQLASVSVPGTKYDLYLTTSQK